MNLKDFLGIAFMCHQRPERSFFKRGKQLPLCARCTGIWIGYILGISIAIITHCKYNTYFLFAIVPMVVDDAIQQIWGIDSNNWRRLFTGILGGVAIIYFFITIHLSTVKLATIVLQYLNWI